MQPQRAGSKLLETIKGQRRVTDTVYSFSDKIIDIKPQGLRIYDLRNKELQMYWQTMRQRQRNGHGCNKISIQKLFENGV